MKVFNLIILDASGSMQSLVKPSVDGVNETIQTIRTTQQNDPKHEQYIGVFAFSSCYSDIIRPIIEVSPIEEVKEIAETDYKPNGCTPLYDAIGKVTKMYDMMMPADSTALVTIITDGYENSSKTYDALDIRKLISRLEEKGWIFTYIGANQDAILESSLIGIQNAMNFSADEEGTKEMWKKERNCRNQFFKLINKMEDINDCREEYNCMRSTYFDEEDKES